MPYPVRQNHMRLTDTIITLKPNTADFRLEDAISAAERMRRLPYSPTPLPYSRELDELYGKLMPDYPPPSEDPYQGHHLTFPMAVNRRSMQIELSRLYQIPKFSPLRINPKTGERRSILYPDLSPEELDSLRPEELIRYRTLSGAPSFTMKDKTSPRVIGADYQLIGRLIKVRLLPEDYIPEEVFSNNDPSAMEDPSNTHLAMLIWQIPTPQITAQRLRTPRWYRFRTRFGATMFRMDAGYLNSVSTSIAIELGDPCYNIIPRIPELYPVTITRPISRFTFSFSDDPAQREEEMFMHSFISKLRPNPGTVMTRRVIPITEHWSRDQILGMPDDSQQLVMNQGAVALLMSRPLSEYAHKERIPRTTNENPFLSEEADPFLENQHTGSRHNPSLSSFRENARLESSAEDPVSERMALLRSRLSGIEAIRKRADLAALKRTGLLPPRMTKGRPLTDGHQFREFQKAAALFRVLPPSPNPINEVEIFCPMDSIPYWNNLPYELLPFLPFLPSRQHPDSPLFASDDLPLASSGEVSFTALHATLPVAGKLPNPDYNPPESWNYPVMMYGGVRSRIVLHHSGIFSLDQELGRVEHSPMLTLIVRGRKTLFEAIFKNARYLPNNFAVLQITRLPMGLILMVFGDPTFSFGECASYEGEEGSASFVGQPLRDGVPPEGNDTFGPERSPAPRPVFRDPFIDPIITRFVVPTALKTQGEVDTVLVGAPIPRHQPELIVQTRQEKAARKIS